MKVLTAASVGVLVVAGIAVYSGVTDPKSRAATPKGAKDEVFTNAQGLRLYVKRWLVANPRGVVFLSHGFGEHINRYTHVAARFNAAGFSVVGLDHQGHGRSDGDRAYVESFSHFVDDYWQFVDREAIAFGKVPKFLVGHSMGGAVAIRVAQRRPEYFNAVVLSGPMIEPAPEAAKPHLIFLANLLSSVVPKLALEPLDAKGVSRDKAVVSAYENDPLVYHGGMKVRVAKEFLEVMDSIRNEASSVKWPFLLMLGTADTLCYPPGGRYFYEHAGSKDKTMREFDGLYHEIFNEPEQEDVLTHVVTFLEKYL